MRVFGHQNCRNNPSSSIASAALCGPSINYPDDSKATSTTTQLGAVGGWWWASEWLHVVVVREVPPCATPRLLLSMAAFCSSRASLPVELNGIELNCTFDNRIITHPPHTHTYRYIPLKKRHREKSASYRYCGSTRYSAVALPW